MKTYGLAAEIAENAPLALKGIKKILNIFGDRVTLDADFLAEAEKRVTTALNSEDLKEGRRPPLWVKENRLFKGY